MEQIGLVTEEVLTDLKIGDSAYAILTLTGTANSLPSFYQTLHCGYSRLLPRV